jgi:hypothetical protein
VTGTDVIGVALDLDNMKLYFARNGTWQDGANPETGANPAFSGLPSGEYAPAVGMRYLAAAATLHASAASFTYAAPSGYSPLDVPVPILAALQQLWGIKLGTDLLHPWADAAVLRQQVLQPWASAPVVLSELVQRWESAFSLRALVVQSWSIHSPIRSELSQPWAITSDIVRADLLQPWDLRASDVLYAELVQRWAIEADGELLRYSVSVLVNGVAIGVEYINVEAGRDQDVLIGDISVGSEADYLRCSLGATVEVTVSSEGGDDTFFLVVTAPKISEEHGNTRYTVEAMSPSVLLGEPYAATLDAELIGKASDIAATLAGSVPLTWGAVDWAIPAATFIASSETPLALIKRLAAACGAVVQSRPDGSILIEPEYPVAVNYWASATPGAFLAENVDCFTTGETPELKSGYNRFYLSNQSAGSVSLRLEEEPISKSIKIVRGYQTPWTGAFALEHSGGSWVVIEGLGVEERQESESIEMVSGYGRTAYPVFGIVSFAWGKRTLGSVLFSEDGTIQADIPGESLLEIVYITRCKIWRVQDQRNESLQLVMP